MKGYNILSRHQPVGQPTFLEASAGTGKTFSIEHLVVRLLLELNPPTTIDRILVVTFTRAATRELGQRIRSNLEAALAQLVSGEIRWDYLQAVTDRPRARRALEQALFAFDEAKIFTIHAFCSEMLRDHAFEGGHSLEGEETLSTEDQLAIVRDYFRTSDDLSPGQLERLISRDETDQIGRKIIGDLDKPPGAALPPFSELFALFVEEVGKVDPAPLRREWPLMTKRYKGIADRSGAIKPEIEEQVEFFFSLFSKVLEPSDFDRLIVEGAPLLELLFRGERKAKAEGSAAEGELRAQWEAFDGLITRARDRRLIFATVVDRCRALTAHVMEEREILTFDGILQLMARSLEQEAFCTSVGNRFDAAIVDEFQDTDATQWKIFQTLFGDGRPLVVVGDPKQSIYAFRGADVYSYLSARDAFGHDERYSLATNFRSRPAMISALNALFREAPGLIPLPKRKEELPVEEVSAGVEESHPLAEEKVIEFLEFGGKPSRTGRFPTPETEEEALFPRITHEIGKICDDHRFAYSDFAVLVADRYQGERVRHYLERHGIPAHTTRGKGVDESSPLVAVEELVAATLDPGNLNKVKCALSSRLVGWTDKEILSLDEGSEVMGVMEGLYHLRLSFDRWGVAAFIEEALNTSWPGMTISAAERLLREEGGDAFLRELYQVGALLTEGKESFDERVAALKKEGGEIHSHTDEAAVQIMTVFASKGLEFPVVFAPALASSSRRSEKALGARPPSEEEEAEKGRLLYVAMTRAKERLYLPLPTEGGGTSPIELFLAKRGVKPFDIPGVKVVKQGVRPLSRGSDEVISLAPPQPLILPRWERQIESFSSLSHPHVSSLEGVPFDFDAPIRSVHTLPAGAETGTFLHEILEKIPFSDEITVSLVTPFVEGTHFEGWEEVIREIVEAAVTAPLPGVSGEFSLCDVDPTKMVREGEFLFGGDERVINGVIDLFFEHEGLYYLLDWKSNWLGPKASCYKNRNLARAMKASQYRLQAELYREALERYLDVVEQRPFERCFGGTFYLFLRGMPDGEGVYALAQT